jgi:hypothetical protein
MKKIILQALLLIISATSFSQQTTPSPTLTKQDYLKKSKGQKTAAWLLLGGGFASTVTGYVIVKNSLLSGDNFLGISLTTGEPDKDIVAGEIFFFTGAAAILGSIPLFIASNRNKKKGLSFSFKNETTPQLQKSSFVHKPVPSLTLKISL